MKMFSAVVAMTMALAAFAGPASARDVFVQDGAGLFSSATVSSLNQTIGDFNRQTGKEVIVVSQASLGGATVEDAAEKVFAQQQVNGVLIFLSKAEKKQGIITDRAAKNFFPPGEVSSIRDAMRGYFRTGDFDTGITTGVNLVLSQYRSHERSLGATTHRTYVPSTSTSTSSFGGGMSLFWLILILIAGFLIIRAVFRAMTRPRMMPPGYGGGPGMPGYGGPGYGGGGMGYGGGGGGGSFFSGLLGGLGGAFIGNEMFGRHDGGNFGDSSNAGIAGGDASNAQDASGWQSDAGQADMSNSSFGDYGSSGGGFDGGGGGGGFDSGGGGGDSGGGGW